MIYSINRQDQKLNEYYNPAIRPARFGPPDVSILPESYKIVIPKERARRENLTNHDMYIHSENYPHYVLYIMQQPKKSRNHDDTFVFFELPESKKLVPIRLHPSGGVSWEPSMRKLVLRETDELDRRIVLGFCLYYIDSLKDATYNPEFMTKDRVQRLASDYTIKKMPKRITQGPRNTEWFQMALDNHLLETADFGMFSKVAFL